MTDIDPLGGFHWLGYISEAEACELTGLPVEQLRAARLYGQLDHPLDENGRRHKDDRGYRLGTFGSSLYPKWNVLEYLAQTGRSRRRM